MVTTPYQQREKMLQLHLLPSRQERSIRIETIDKFQGQEDEVIIISMVRSNSKADYKESIGFVNIPAILCTGNPLSR
jgi:superfamily I DNA and/or RNA helicase